MTVMKHATVATDMNGKFTHVRHGMMVIDSKREVFTFPGLFRMESIWNPYGIHGIHQEFHMESMEWMLAETPANFFFHGQHGIHVEWWWNGHGMINSIWNSHGFHWIPYGMQASPCGFHGTSPYGFHGTNPHGFHDHCTIRIHINSTRNHWIVTE